MKMHKEKPVLKVGEWDREQGGGAYIYFDEKVNIPGLERSSIRFEFETNDSVEEVQKLISLLRNRGFTLVVQNG